MTFVVQRSSQLRATLLLLLVAASPATAQVTLAEYEQRRAALASQLPEGVFVARGGEEPVEDYRSFFQSPGFFYLTGYREPGAALLMHKQGTAVQWFLFVQERNPSVEVWSGRRYGPERAGRATGLSALPASRFRPTLDSLLRTTSRLTALVDLAEGGDTLNRDDRFLEELRRDFPNLEIAGANAIVDRMRGTKSAAELDLITRAAYISALAHREAARAIRPGASEFEVQAALEATFRRHGADRPAYASIVGSGPNSTVLHYNRNDRFMESGELLLIDAAASYGGYAADITRTFPVSGRFSPEQRAIYEVVRAAQARVERLLRPGTPFRALNDTARAVLAEGLARIGLIDSASATYECSTGRQRQCSQLSLFYMHGLGHGIGLVVHDPEQAYYPPGTIGPGSAFTIEPGLYVRDNLLDIVPDTPANASFRARLARLLPRYANIGVRIEDDYIVTDEGVRWISCAVPREPDEVEALVRGDNATSSASERLADWYKTLIVDPSGARPGTPAPPRCPPLPRN
jgi:Xaa-Pro aminopeptidase